MHRPRSLLLRLTGMHPQREANLLHRLAAHPEQPVPPGVKDDVLAYYSKLDLPFATRKDPQAWAALQTDLNTFKTIPTSRQPEPYPTYGDDNANADEQSPTSALTSAR